MLVTLTIIEIDFNFLSYKHKAVDIINHVHYFLNSTTQALKVDC